jgi:hypothetical protein
VTGDRRTRGPGSLAVAARALAASRVAFGAALLVAPSAVAGPTFIGSDARPRGAAVLIRAFAIRDLLLGAAGLATAGDVAASRRVFAAHLAADVNDGLAVLAARGIPAFPRAFALTAATGSAAISAAMLARLA